MLVCILCYRILSVTAGHVHVFDLTGSWFCWGDLRMQTHVDICWLVLSQVCPTVGYIAFVIPCIFIIIFIYTCFIPQPLLVLPSRAVYTYIWMKQLTVRFRNKNKFRRLTKEVKRVNREAKMIFVFCKSRARLTRDVELSCKFITRNSY